jgi:hypothetical protein
MFRNLERPVPVGPVGSDQRVATITKQLRIEKDIQLLGMYKQNFDVSSEGPWTALRREVTYTI